MECWHRHLSRKSKLKQIPQPQRQKDMRVISFSSWQSLAPLQIPVIAQGFLEDREKVVRLADLKSHVPNLPYGLSSHYLSVSLIGETSSSTWREGPFEGFIVKSPIQVGWLEVATSYVTRSTQITWYDIIHPGKINLDIQNRYISVQFSLQVMLLGIQLSFFRISPSWYPAPSRPFEQLGVLHQPILLPGVGKVCCQPQRRYSTDPLEWGWMTLNACLCGFCRDIVIACASQPPVEGRKMDLWGSLQMCRVKTDRWSWEQVAEAPLFAKTWFIPVLDMHTSKP